MRLLLTLLVMLGAAQTAAAQIDYKLNPLFRPKGAIVNKGSARYYVWYEGSTWHVRTTAPKGVRFNGSVTVKNGKITYGKVIGREQNQDVVRFSPDRKSVSFSLYTSTLSDGIDIRTSGEKDAEVIFQLGLGKKKKLRLSNVLVGADQQNPKKLPLVFPAKPNRTMYAGGANPPADAARQFDLPPDPILMLTFDPKSFGKKDDKEVIWDYSKKKNVSSLYQATPTTGKVGGGLAFDPEASGIFTQIRQQDVKTIALWVNLKELGPFRSIVSGGGNNKGFAINLGGNGRCKLTYGTGKTYVGVGGPHALPVGKWAHVAAVIDTSGKKFSYYVNGLRRHTGAIAQPIAGLDECKLVFSVNWKGHALSGAIDEAVVYDRVLSAQEIATLHEMGKAGVSLVQAQK